METTNRGIESPPSRKFSRSACIFPTSNSERMWYLRAFRRSVLKRPKPHLHALSSQWSTLPVRERALHLIYATSARRPEWTFCYLSAALIRKLTDTVFVDAQTHVVARTHTHTRDGGSVKFHYCLADISKQRSGIPVTPLLQTVFDCARRLDYSNALAICDRAKRRYGLTRPQLIAYADSKSRCWGGKRARYVFSRASPLNESGGEPIARAHFDAWGYEEPCQQVSLPSPLHAGRHIRLDFLWVCKNGRRIAGELDGREEYLNPTMRQSGNMVDGIVNEKTGRRRFQS
ncbi:hypothetical protein [Bifidobacterium xylocopae]|uniref:hypothetical protein n=1 Tax=Bifidobacterium xylocopae TaxID=2493119 RepID=UPI000FDF4D6D|nr:hypothetical protein [Bifidobacterium xylocopae]